MRFARPTFLGFLFALMLVFPCVAVAGSYGLAKETGGSGATLEKVRGEFCTWGQATFTYTNVTEQWLALLAAHAESQCWLEAEGWLNTWQKDQLEHLDKITSEVVAVKAELAAIKIKSEETVELLKGTLKVVCTGCSGGGGGSSEIEFSPAASEVVRAGGQGGAVLLLGGAVAFMFAAALWSLVRQKGS